MIGEDVVSPLTTPPGDVHLSFQLLLPTKLTLTLQGRIQGRIRGSRAVWRKGQNVPQEPAQSGLEDASESDGDLESVGCLEFQGWGPLAVAPDALLHFVRACGNRLAAEGYVAIGAGRD